MKLHLEHTFPGTRALYWEASRDDGLDAQMASAGSSRREILSRTESGGVVTLVQRFHIDAELPATVRTLLGSDTLSYDQTSVIDEANDRIRWSVVPPVQKDRVTAEGTVTLRDGPGGVVRVIDGEVSVRVPFVGGKIEAAIVKAIEDGYTKAADIQRAWMAARATGGASGNA